MTIELAASEVLRHSAIPWGELDAAQRKHLAAAILRARPDDESQRLAFYIESNNPNYSNFRIVANR